LICNLIADTSLTTLKTWRKQHPEINWHNWKEKIINISLYWMWHDSKFTWSLITFLIHFLVCVLIHFLSFLGKHSQGSLCRIYTSGNRNFANIAQWSKLKGFEGHPQFFWANGKCHTYFQGTLGTTCQFLFDMCEYLHYVAYCNPANNDTINYNNITISIDFLSSPSPCLLFSQIGFSHFVNCLRHPDFSCAKEGELNFKVNGRWPPFTLK
jgi:hypothetical protein